jgi:hypothetical protein
MTLHQKTARGKKEPKRLFILGAGASKACGLPLANELLREVVTKDVLQHRDRLLELLEYLYARFRRNWANFPNIEEFLSLIDVTTRFNEKVKTSHKFKNAEIEQLRDDLLIGVSKMLLHDDPSETVKGTPLLAFAKNLRASDTVVTFNWDLLLEGALFASGTTNWSYVGSDSKPTILKPHGSVDWYDSSKVSFKEGRSYPLIRKMGNICVFQYFHSPRVKEPILPVIIPPSVVKEWKYEEFDEIWRRTWSSMRYADEIYIIGFSLPPEDLHVRFVMRSALRANENDRQYPLILKLVNPDRAVHQRFTQLIDSPIKYYECGFDRISTEELTSSE